MPTKLDPEVLRGVSGGRSPISFLSDIAGPSMRPFGDSGVGTVGPNWAFSGMMAHELHNQWLDQLSYLTDYGGTNLPDTTPTDLHGMDSALNGEAQQPEAEPTGEAPPDDPMYTEPDTSDPAANDHGNPPDADTTEANVDASEAAADADASTEESGVESNDADASAEASDAGDGGGDYGDSGGDYGGDYGADSGGGDDGGGDYGGDGGGGDGGGE